MSCSQNYIGKNGSSLPAANAKCASAGIYLSPLDGPAFYRLRSPPGSFLFSHLYGYPFDLTGSLVKHFKIKARQCTVGSFRLTEGVCMCTGRAFLHFISSFKEDFYA